MFRKMNRLGMSHCPFLLNLCTAFMTYQHALCCDMRSTPIMIIWCNVSALLVEAEHHRHFNGLLQGVSMKTVAEKLRTSLQNEESCESCDFFQNNKKLRKKWRASLGKGYSAINIFHYETLLDPPVHERFFSRFVLKIDTIMDGP